MPWEEHCKAVCDYTGEKDLVSKINPDYWQTFQTENTTIAPDGTLWLIKHQQEDGQPFNIGVRIYHDTSVKEFKVMSLTQYKSLKDGEQIIYMVDKPTGKVTSVFTMSQEEYNNFINPKVNNG